MWSAGILILLGIAALWGGTGWLGILLPAALLVWYADAHPMPIRRRHLTRDRE